MKPLTQASTPISATSKTATTCLSVVGIASSPFDRGGLGRCQQVSHRDTVVVDTKFLIDTDKGIDTGCLAIGQVTLTECAQSVHSCARKGVIDNRQRVAPYGQHIRYPRHIDGEIAIDGINTCDSAVGCYRTRSQLRTIDQLPGVIVGLAKVLAIIEMLPDDMSNSGSRYLKQ